MENSALIELLQSHFQGAVIEQGQDWPEMTIEPDQLISTITLLKENQQLGFDFLFCLTSVDWKTHLTMVYHLESTSQRHSMVLKAKLNREQPEIESLSAIYRTAEFHEREVYDLFGVVFKNHPDLRRLLLTDDWKGYPLRKDYEDPINMIKL